MLCSIENGKMQSSSLHLSITTIQAIILLKQKKFKQQNLTSLSSDGSKSARAWILHVCINYHSTIS